MELVNADCLEHMKKLPDKSVDLFLCDLPYGCLTGGGGKEKAKRRSKNSQDVIAGCDWDVPINLVQFWEQVERLMKDEHTPVLMFCSTKFGFELYNSNPNWFRYDLVWEKLQAVGFLNANKQPMRSHELIYVFAKKGATYYRKDIDVEGAKEWKQFGKPKTKGCYNLLRENEVVRPVGEVTSKEGKRCIKSVFQFANKKGNHPTAKPVDLYKFLIERYSKEGDTVLDPTAGSFNSGLAAKELNRKYIGIEMSEDFYKKGVELLQE